jgi:mannonate dehydratase
LAAQEKVAKAVRGLPSPKIKDVSVIATAPAWLRLVVVKITTDQDGLYGFGCGTFTQRADLVVAAVEKYLKPFLIGKPADRIEDIWNASYNSSYWRNGPVLNNAISGVDEALWDIKGRQANMPVYQLLGGKVREAADCYGHADGAEYAQTIENARKWIEQGFRFVRVQVGVPGMAGYGARRGEATVKALHNGPVFEPSAYIRRALKLFEESRKALGDEIELLHDVHERVAPDSGRAICQGCREIQVVFLGRRLIIGRHRVFPPDPAAMRNTVGDG